MSEQETRELKELKEKIEKTFREWNMKHLETAILIITQWSIDNPDASKIGVKEIIDVLQGYLNVEIDKLSRN